MRCRVQKARAASSKGTFSSVPALFGVDSGTNLIKQGGGNCLRSTVWLGGQSARMVCERSMARVPVGPCAFSSPVTETTPPECVIWLELIFNIKLQYFVLNLLPVLDRIDGNIEKMVSSNQIFQQFFFFFFFCMGSSFH